MTHLRVFERQGPIHFSRSACGASKRTRQVAVQLTDTVKLVSCDACKKTKFFRQASDGNSDPGETK